MDPFVAEIRIFAGNFAPRGWAFCSGQLLPISQNTALFSLLGTFYGGDGKSTFGLPDLGGNVPVSQGQGPGLEDYFIGEVTGAESITLISTELPAHTHPGIQANLSNATRENPAGNVPAAGGQMIKPYTTVHPAGIGSLNNFTYTGDSPSGDMPHNNMQPYLAMTYIIAMQGVYPSRG